MSIFLFGVPCLLTIAVSRLSQLGRAKMGAGRKEVISLK